MWSMTFDIEYRGYTIRKNPPPIPTNRHDWEFVHIDYDGPEDSRIGTAPSVDAAKEEIDEQILEREGM